MKKSVLTRKLGRFTVFITTFAQVSLLSVLMVACSFSPKISNEQQALDSMTRDDDYEGTIIDPFYKVPDAEESSEEYGSVPPAKSRNFFGFREKKGSSSTVLALLAQAKKQERLGRPERAAAVLERALRIEPKNATLWHRLALIRLQQGKLDLAKSFAAKSTSLSQNDASLKLKNNTIIKQVLIMKDEY